MMVCVLLNSICGLNPFKNEKSLIHERVYPISFIPIFSYIWAYPQYVTSKNNSLEEFIPDII